MPTRFRGGRRGARAAGQRVRLLQVPRARGRRLHLLQVELEGPGQGGGTLTRSAFRGGMTPFLMELEAPNKNLHFRP